MLKQVTEQCDDLKNQILILNQKLAASREQQDHAGTQNGQLKQMDERLKMMEALYLKEKGEHDQLKKSSAPVAELEIMAQTVASIEEAIQKKEAENQALRRQLASSSSTPSSSPASAFVPSRVEVETVKMKITWWS